MLWVGVSLLGAALAVANARGTRRIWRSGMYQPGQLVAQTALIWIVPGSVFAVLGVLGGEPPRRTIDDPTVRNPERPNDHIDFYSGTGHAP